MSEIKDGTYIVRNVANLTLGLDSKGATDGNGENVHLWTVNKRNDGTYVNVQTCTDNTELSETFTGDGSTDIFALATYTTAVTRVEVDAVEQVLDTDYTVALDETSGLYEVTFTTAPTSGVTIDIYYYKCWRLLVFPATGKAVSVGVSSGGPRSGDKVYQWDIRGNGLGGGEQRWVIDSIGSTATLSGKTYDVFKVHMSLHPTWILEVRGVGTPSSGADVCISTDDGDAQDQMWIFESADPVFPGTYRIVTKKDASKCCYVNGASKSAGARIGVQPWTGAQNQVWKVEEAPNGRRIMRPVHSFGDFATFASNTATQGDQCCQDGHSASATDHQWIPQPQDGKTIMVDGSSYQCYQMLIYAGRGLVLDIPQANTEKWLQIYASNGSDAQMWAFVPAEVYDQDLHTPTGVGVLIGETEYTSGNVIWDSTEPIFPIWDCSGTKFQARYRTRAIGISDSGTETYPYGWTGWKSVADGTESNDGWGTAWLPNQIFTTPADHKVGESKLSESFTGDGSTTTYILERTPTGTVAVTVDGSEKTADTDYIYDPTTKQVTFTVAPASDAGIVVEYVTSLEITGLTVDNPACDIQVEVRYFTENWGDHGVPAHGASASGTVRVYTPMSVEATSITRTGEGLVVAFSSDWATGATIARIGSLTNGTADLVEAVTASGKYAGGDSITVPWNLIDQHIAIGDEVTLELDLTTALGVAGTTTYTGTVIDGGDQGVTPTYVETDHASYTVTVPHPVGETTKAYLLQDGVRPMEIKPSSTGRTSDIYDLMVPLNTEGHYEVIVSGFAVGMLTLPAIASHFSVWTFGDGDWAVLDWGYGKNPTQEDSQEADTDEYQLTGREYHAYRKRASRTRDLSMTGVFVESMPEHGSREAMMRLLKAGHAIYRNLRGEIHNVYISSISLPLEDTRYTEVSVTQYAETR